jgi:hypothetical protein
MTWLLLSPGQRMAQIVRDRLDEFLTEPLETVAAREEEVRGSCESSFAALTERPYEPHGQPPGALGWFVPKHDVAAVLGPNTAVRTGAEWDTGAGRSTVRASPAQLRPHSQPQSLAIRPDHVASLEVRASPRCGIVATGR